MKGAAWYTESGFIAQVSVERRVLWEHEALGAIPRSYTRKQSMRKRTFQDRKFSQGDSNSDAYRDNWDATFAEKCNFCGHPESEHSEEECLHAKCPCGIVGR